jgi:hypothetical protein
MRNMATASPTNNFVQRLIGAASLDVAIYEEVEADRTATGQAVAVVILSSIAAGIGSRGFGGRLLPEPQTQVDMGELLRTIGFANTPGLLRVFGIIPAVSYPAFVIAAVWMLLAMIVAVRQALDYKSTGRAVVVCAIGWVLSIILTVIFGLFLGPPVT